MAWIMQVASRCSSSYWTAQWNDTVGLHSIQAINSVANWRIKGVEIYVEVLTDSLALRTNPRPSLGLYNYLWLVFLLEVFCCELWIFGWMVGLFGKRGLALGEESYSRLKTSGLQGLSSLIISLKLTSSDSRTGVWMYMPNY